jgi:hypothetical protein
MTPADEVGRPGAADSVDNSLPTSPHNPLYGISANRLHRCEQVHLQNLISLSDTLRVECLTHP